ncbi:MAG: outer membrane beta-barrel protein [Chitinophagaceae bacterium]|nr:outer membrane beta-barrel protein [Chitinophagaceae bacterium]
MKKLLLTLSLSMFIIAANAQKGNWYVGGNLGFSSSQSKIESGNTETKAGKTTSWSVSPEVGTFLTNQIQLGVAFTLTGSKFESQQNINFESKNNSYGGTVYSRYFFGKEAFKPFIGLNASYLSGKSESRTGGTVNSEITTSTLGVNANAGFGYALSKRVTALGSFGFLGFESFTRKPNDNTKNTTNTFGFDANSLGNRFTIGFYYTL